MRHCYAAITNSLLSHSLFSPAHHLLHRSNNLSDSFICKFIIALGNRGDIRRTIHWFHKAKSFSHGRCLLFCNAVLVVLVRANRINLSKSIFDQCTQGVREMFCAPNSVTYNTLIHGFCKNGDMEGAKRVFDRMVEVRGQSCKPDVGCHPNVLTYNTLIEGLCLGGNVGEAMKMMTRM
ncbi:Pentatricopeptide repeat-containing protein [Arachis hypogaea]|nr:Pentatricopeptide repeat-containing protein [Arachis hypogaea]